MNNRGEALRRVRVHAALIKWHPSQPVQHVADGTPEPIVIDIPILRGVFLFPKSVSGTSGKSRENMGTGMAETSDDEIRAFFLGLQFDGERPAINYWYAIRWGQNRVRELEQHACDMGQLLEQREKEFADLQSHLQERNATINQLEADLRDYRTHAKQTLSSMTPESDEDRHQRRRRERMLDQVTLICVRAGMDKMEVGVMNERGCGKISRDAADNICRGINQYDHKH